jgi:trehalose/maltose hydrolase-like predicted phosphorylase
LIAGNYVADESLGPRLAVFPHRLHVEVMVEGRQLSLQAGRVLEHRRLLDLRQGVLFREWRQQDPSGRITRLKLVMNVPFKDRLHG